MFITCSSLGPQLPHRVCTDKCHFKVLNENEQHGNDSDDWNLKHSIKQQQNDQSKSGMKAFSFYPEYHSEQQVMIPE